MEFCVLMSLIGVPLDGFDHLTMLIIDFIFSCDLYSLVTFLTQQSYSIRQIIDRNLVRYQIIRQ